jgi:hypothetical protein
MATNALHTRQLDVVNQTDTSDLQNALHVWLPILPVPSLFSVSREKQCLPRLRSALLQCLRREMLGRVYVYEVT